MYEKLLALMHVLYVHACCTETKSVFQIPWNWSWRWLWPSMWVLRTKHWSSVRGASAHDLISNTRGFEFRGINFADGDWNYHSQDGYTSFDHCQVRCTHEHISSLQWLPQQETLVFLFYRLRDGDIKIIQVLELNRLKARLCLLERSSTALQHYINAEGVCNDLAVNHLLLGCPFCCLSKCVANSGA